LGSKGQGGVGDGRGDFMRNPIGVTDDKNIKSILSIQREH